jgi:hypothetical protein
MQHYENFEDTNHLSVESYLFVLCNVSLDSFSVSFLHFRHTGFC